MSEPTLREIADKLDRTKEVSSPWIHTKLTPMLRDATDVIEGLEHENAKLQDENARLRSCLSDDAENARMIMGENAKLRELVRIMAYCMQNERECDGCRLNSADGTIMAPAGCDGLLDRMRELFGKENDGCSLV
jgi:hypothetical protein